MMLNHKKYRFFVLSMSLLSSAVMFFSCQKEKGIGEDPYANAKKPLDITFVSKTTDPEIVNAGDVLSVKVRGLNKYIDKMQLFVNEIPADVIKEQSNDTTLTFKIPIEASTGSMWITAEGQTFFGPIVKIGGKISINPNWKVVTGATSLNNGPTTIYDIEQLLNGNYYLGGAFNTFDLKGTEKLPNSGIVQIGPDGAYIANAAFGKGAGTVFPMITTISRLATGKFIVSGQFSSFNSARPNRQTLYNVARLNSNGSLDSVIINDIVNPKPAETNKNADTLSAFNAGVEGAVRKSFVYGDQVYFIGDFLYYNRMFIRGSSYDQKIYDRVRMRQLVRVNSETGELDLTFNYDANNKQSYAGANGTITDAMIQPDNKLVLVGTFTTFHGVPANRIVRLNLDGTVDPTFKAGTGANDDIRSIRYNTTTQQIVITGLFQTFNGKSAAGVNLLDKDGNNVSTFTPLPITGGYATFGGQLNNGKIIIAGSFTKYGTYMRQGFMVLDNNGQLSVGYNNTGGFQGIIFDMTETKTATGTNVILVGQINRFNATIPGNIISLNFAN